MPRISKLLAAAAACLMLSACTSFSPATDDLMRPPRLTPEQRAINDALDDAALTQNYSLKYPKSGDHRSAFVFHDIDGDGEEEAIVFYEPSIDNTARIVLLDQQDGVWRSLCDLPGAGQDVEFVAFANITAKDASDVVVGWSGSDREEKQLRVYRYSPADRVLVNALAEGVSPGYTTYLIDDLDRNGQADVFLLSSNSRTTLESFWINLLSFDGDAVDIVDKKPLPERILQFAGVTAGRLSAGSARRAIFVDELIPGDSLAVGSTDILVTEVFSVADGELVPVISYSEEGEGEEADYDRLDPDYQKPSLYQMTKRPNTASGANNPNSVPSPLCTDIDGDRAIEIPTARLLPGYDQVDEADRLYLTEYNRLEKDELVRVFAAAINRGGGYMVEFPQQWIGAVTIVNQMENGEWRFIGYNGSDDPLNDLSVELARIRVVSQKDYQDKFLENYQKFSESRGMFSYYGYIPESPSSPLAITWTDLQDMFSLL